MNTSDAGGPLAAGAAALPATGTARTAGVAAAVVPEHVSARVPDTVAARVPDRVTSGMQISADLKSGDMVVRVHDPVTGEFLRQIPTEEALAMAQAIGTLQGIFVSEKA